MADDVFGGSSDEEGDWGGGRTAAAGAGSETAAQRRILQDAGYRDGAGGEEGHALGLQEGFDEGFAQGMADGRALGQVLGACSGVHALEERVPRGLPVPPLADEDKGRLEASIDRLTALAPTMPAATDPALASEQAEAVRLVAAAGVCQEGDRSAVERVVGLGEGGGTDAGGGGL